MEGAWGLLSATSDEPDAKKLKSWPDALFSADPAPGAAGHELELAVNKGNTSGQTSGERGEKCPEHTWLLSGTRMSGIFVKWTVDTITQEDIGEVIPHYPVKHEAFTGKLYTAYVDIGGNKPEPNEHVSFAVFMDEQGYLRAGRVFKPDEARSDKEYKPRCEMTQEEKREHNLKRQAMKRNARREQRQLELAHLSQMGTAHLQVAGGLVPGAGKPGEAAKFIPPPLHPALAKTLPAETVRELIARGMNLNVNDWT